jgi:hypothetical protein
MIVLLRNHLLVRKFLQDGQDLLKIAMLDCVEKRAKVYGSFAVDELLDNQVT